MFFFVIIPVVAHVARVSATVVGVCYFLCGVPDTVRSDGINIICVVYEVVEENFVVGRTEKVNPLTIVGYIVVADGVIGRNREADSRNIVVIYVVVTEDVV